MAKTTGNKAKGRQSSKRAGYYTQQFFRTTANKARRAKQRERWLANRRAKRSSLVGALVADAKRAAWASRRIARLTRDIQHDEAAIALAQQQDKTDGKAASAKLVDKLTNRIGWARVRINDLRNQFNLQEVA